MQRLTEETLQEVTAQIGFAVWQIQILEGAVATYLIFVHKAKPGMARQEVEEMFTKARKSTLGNLLRQLGTSQTASSPLAEQLDKFVEDRNWLVHRSRHESHRCMNSVSGRAALIARLLGIADDALRLMKDFQSATEAHLATLGVPKEQIDQDAARQLKEWGILA